MTKPHPRRGRRAGWRLGRRELESPDLTCAEWWQLLADAGYSAPMLPEEAGGKGWTRDLAHAVTRTRWPPKRSSARPPAWA